MLAAFTAYNVSVFIHVTAAVVGFGATFVLSLAFPLALQLDSRHLPYVHRLGLAINQKLATPALVVVLVTGFYQVAEGDWSFGDLWISLTFLIVIILGGLMGAYLIPSERRLATQVEHDLADQGVPSAGYTAAAQLQGRIGGLAGLLVIAAIFLMIVKPGA